MPTSVDATLTIPEARRPMGGDSGIDSTRRFGPSPWNGHTREAGLKHFGERRTDLFERAYFRGCEGAG